jgi:heme/copper-type cytochrome/quinol oxidase subunit 2
MRFFVVKKETFLFFLAVGFVLVTISAWFILKAGDTTVFNQKSSGKTREIHMVATEFKTTMKNGKEMEAYHWFPDTIHIKKDEKVQLFIDGINGVEHQFYIEGTKIKGTVKKGEETLVSLQFQKKGTYQLICNSHSDMAHNGPMTANIVVE